MFGPTDKNAHSLKGWVCDFGTCSGRKCVVVRRNRTFCFLLGQSERSTSDESIRSIRATLFPALPSPLLRSVRRGQLMKKTLKALLSQWKRKENELSRSAHFSFGVSTQY